MEKQPYQIYVLKDLSGAFVEFGLERSEVFRDWDFPGGSDSKVSAYNAGDLGLIPGLGRSPGEGNGNPLHTPAWKIPWTEQHGRLLLSLGSQRVGHD